MTEQAPTFESEPQRDPSEAEVFALFESVAGEGYVTLKKEEDEQGLYLWDISTKDEAGDRVDYSYMRKGNYPEGNPLETTVYVTLHSSEGIPVGGERIATFVNGEWRYTTGGEGA